MAPTWIRPSLTLLSLEGAGVRLTLFSTAFAASRSLPPGERISSPPSGTSFSKLRPRPLSFVSAVTRNMSMAAVDPHYDDATSFASSTSYRSPRPFLLKHYFFPLAKKLYEGLGSGRPTPPTVPSHPPALPQRLVSQPVRKPRGPPSGADVLCPKNFASHITVTHVVVYPSCGFEIC